MNNLASAPPPPTAARVSELVDALEDEAKLVTKLHGELLMQREGVAHNDPRVIEDTIHAMGRSVLTLEEARRRRQALLALMVGREGVTLTDLETHFGDPLPEELERARAVVRKGASTVARELTINQHVLDRAIHAGDAFLQRLFSSVAETSPDYAPAAIVGDRHQDAVLVNKTV